MPTPLPYVVTKIWHETHNVGVLELSPKNGGEVFSFLPGQFVMVRLFRGGEFWRQEAYSICSSPRRRDALQLSFKVYGEFTQELDALKPGDALELTGPHGRFVLKPEMNDIVLVAGGVGITPFLSMVRYACESMAQFSLTLLNFNHSANDIAFRKDIESCAQQNPRFAYKFFLSDNSNAPEIEKARLSEELLQKHAHPAAERYYFLCGPQGFMDTAKNFYLAHDIPKDHVIVEKF